MVTPKASSNHGHPDGIRTLVLERLEILRRQEHRIGNLPLRDFYVCQESILEEVLRRAQDGLDDDSLVAWVDLCIRESLLFRKLTTDRGLKSFYGLRVRILRGFLALVRKRFSLKRWFRRRKVRHPRSH
jgi:hypothetical protein